MENPRFLNHNDLEQIKIEFGTPCFVYDESILRENAKMVLSFPNEFGLFARYAMKSAPTAAILRILIQKGLESMPAPFMRWKERFVQVMEPN